MPEALATPAKPRHWLTGVVYCMVEPRRVQRPQRVAKPLPKPRASEWLLDSVYGLWLAFIAGLRVEAGRCSLGLPKAVRGESDGNG